MFLRPSFETCFLAHCIANVYINVRVKTPGVGAEGAGRGTGLRGWAEGCCAHALFALADGTLSPQLRRGSSVPVVSLDLPTASGLRLSPGHPGVEAAGSHGSAWHRACRTGRPCGCRCAQGPCLGGHHPAGRATPRPWGRHRARESRRAEGAWELAGCGESRSRGAQPLSPGRGHWTGQRRGGRARGGGGRGIAAQGSQWGRGARGACRAGPQESRHQDVADSGGRVKEAPRGLTPVSDRAESM